MAYYIYVAGRATEYQKSYRGGNKMKATNLEMELIRRAINRKDLPKGCRSKIFYYDEYFDINFKLKYAEVTFFSEKGRLFYKVFMYDKPITEEMTINEVRDIDFAFGQLVHFNEEEANR